MNASIRIYLVEDHPAVRQGLRLLLELDGMDVCGEAEDARTALGEIPGLAPSLVMVDLSLGEDSGLDLLRALAQRCPELPTLAYSMFEDTLHVKRAFGAGARGYVTKREASDVLIQAIQECLAGRTFASPRAVRGLAKGDGLEVDTEPLSLQEQEVLDLLGLRLSTKEIAASLNLSPRTVETYYSRIQTKLKLRGMSDLRRIALKTAQPK